ncbi:MAG TPA: ATP-binding protein [Actinophytocola sp.]|nr:ATP-binding protein [Actinophytocola sp.]
MAQPASGAFRSELDGSGSVTKLLVRFTAAGIVVVVLLAIGIAVVARMQAIQKGIDEARNTTWVVAHAIQPSLVPGLADGDPLAVAALDTAVRRFVLGGSLVRVKIWDADGRILYSDAAPLIGKRFVLGADERRALDEGNTVAGVSELEDPENTLEADFGKLLEVYLGLRTTSGQPVLFEAYFRYNDVVSAGWETWRRFAPLAVGALLVLELVQVPLAVALARRLQRGEQRRRRLLDIAVRASDAERRRIASDLHDGVVQDITGVTYELDAARIGAAGCANPDERDATLAETARRLRGCARSLRTLLLDIYPPNLSAEGLRPALADLAASASTDQLTVQAHQEHFEEPPPHVAALLYRAAQEAIRNAARHSGAGRVDLFVSRRHGLWELVVDDDGRGMVAGRVEERREEGHLGLHALGELVADAGGSLALHSAPDAGTRVEVRVPAQ